MTPDAYTNQELFIEVGDGHTVYVNDWGNLKATTPILFLHGGPGGGTSDKHKQQYDPKRQRVIFFDQRGTGRSIPHGSLEHNTTKELISDISKILDKLDIECCILKGGSWGCCLALAYGITHPDRVTAMVLDGIFTGSQSEIDWLERGMFKTFFPDAWQEILNKTPASHHANPTTYHTKRALHGKNIEDAKASGFAYQQLEYAVLTLDDRKSPIDYETYDPSDIQMEMWYISNRCFMEDNFILDHARKLTMPIYLIQGRYDMVCPPTTAYALHHVLPNSELIWTISGHAASRESWTVMKTLLMELSK
jgi:proline iminopeptidase